jgi:hypothetical protein
MSDSTEKKTARCRDCGLLALCVGGTDFVPLPLKIRKSWGGHSVQDFGESDGRPHCAADVFTPDDLKAIATNRPDAISAMTEKERSCSKFFPLSPGRDPEWHQDQAMLAEQQRRDDDRRKDDRNARKEDQQSEREYRRSEKRWDRLFTVALAVATFFLGWYLKDKWFIRAERIVAYDHRKMRLIQREHILFGEGQGF